MNPKLETIPPNTKPKPKEKRENFANSGSLSTGFSRRPVVMCGNVVSLSGLTEYGIRVFFSFFSSALQSDMESVFFFFSFFFCPSI